jgi:hypothetical protein
MCEIEMDKEFWKIEYISCEGNYRWATARSPKGWDEQEVKSAIPKGSMGDDVSFITEVSPSLDNDFFWDLE